MQPIANGISGIYETHLPVQDLDRSIAFYRDALGLTLARRISERNIAFLWAGTPETGMLGLWGAGAAPLRMTLHFAFRAAFDAVLTAPGTLSAQGITPLGFDGEPISEPVVIGWMPALSIYFKDPDGHSIEMLHKLNDTPDPNFGTGPWSDWQTR